MTTTIAATGQISWDVPKGILASKRATLVAGHHLLVAGHHLVDNQGLVAYIVESQPAKSEIVISQIADSGCFSRLRLQPDAGSEAVFNFINYDDRASVNDKPFTWNVDFGSIIQPIGFPKTYDSRNGLPTPAEIEQVASGNISGSPKTPNSLIAAHYRGCLDLLDTLQLRTKI